MKIGDYARTKNGNIFKIEDITDVSTFDYSKKIIFDSTGWYVTNEEIIKSSDKLIDLVQVGDYVNGEKITRVIPEDVCGDEVLDYQHIFVGDEEIYKEDIKSIVTKEQFESMEYKLGE